jgi:type I restriction-modification system DNA methylase subunit
VVFHELGNVVRRADAEGQLHVEWGDSWHDIRFDHIPIGLLSQVYEHHAHRFDPHGARQTSVLYTPRHLALYVVDEIFNELGDAAADARVLDPSAGGGVFLVEAFRRIAEARWRVDGRQPDAAKLREILYRQLQGFDISEPALRLCTLGLYLTAIELDPEPNLEELRFPEPLMGSVLHDVASPVKGHAYIGSLSDQQLGDRHRHRYDVVLGNPPWSTWESTSETERRGRRADRRGRRDDPPDGRGAPRRGDGGQVLDGRPRARRAVRVAGDGVGQARRAHRVRAARAAVV